MSVIVREPKARGVCCGLEGVRWYKTHLDARHVELESLRRP
jgi:hypothetical protein